MYQRALNIDPTHIVSLCNLGLLLHDVRREYDEALAVFDQAMEAASDADDILVHHLASTHHKAGSARPDPKAMALPPIFPHQDAHQGVLKTEMDALRQRQSSHYLSHLSTILKDKEQQKSERPADAAPPAESSPAAQARPGGPDAAGGGEVANKTSAREAAAEDGQQGGGEGGEGGAATAAEASAGADGSKAAVGAPKFVGTLLRQQQRQREEELKKKQVLVTAMILKSATLALRAVGLPALPSARFPPPRPVPFSRSRSTLLTSPSQPVATVVCRGTPEGGRRLTASARAQADGIGAEVEKRLTRPGKLPEFFVVLKHAYLHYYRNQDLYVSNDKEVDVFWLKFCRLKEIHEVGSQRCPDALPASSLCRTLLSTSCQLLFVVPPPCFCCPCLFPFLRNATK